MPSELTREQILAVATTIHDDEWDCRGCDRRKYRHSCPRFADAVLEAGKRIRQQNADGDVRGDDDERGEPITARAVKYMPIANFREQGYLQELNRQFLHPLGLALEVVVNDDGTEHLGGIWDYRNDPDGIQYGAGQLDAAKAQHVLREFCARAPARQQLLGYVEQPIDDNWVDVCRPDTEVSK